MIEGAAGVVLAGLLVIGESSVVDSLVEEVQRRFGEMACETAVVGRDRVRKSAGRRERDERGEGLEGVH